MFQFDMFRANSGVLKGAVRRVAHAHYDTYVIIKPDSGPDGTAIRDTRTSSAGCDGDGRSYG